jgi:hypothetical protein
MHASLDLEDGLAVFNGEVEQMLKPGDPAPTEVMRLLGLALSPLGEPLGITGWEEMVALAQEAPPGAPATTAGVNEATSEWIATAGPLLPAAPLSPGDSWTLHTPDLPLEVPELDLDMSVTHTFKSVGMVEGHRVARFGMHSEADLHRLARLAVREGARSSFPAMEDEQMHGALLQAFLPEIYDATLVMDGDWYFDLDAGTLHSARGTCTLSLAMETPPVPDMPPGTTLLGVDTHFTLSTVSP